MKLSDFKFKDNVRFSDMVEMAGKLVKSMFENPDARLNMMIGYDYLFLQAATRLFTDYGVIESQGDIDAFMDMVFSIGMERYENTIAAQVGKEKYEAFKQMVERGVRHYLDMGPLEMLVDEAGIALHQLNQMIEQSGELTPENAIALLRQYVAEQEEPPQE